MVLMERKITPPPDDDPYYLLREMYRIPRGPSKPQAPTLAETDKIRRPPIEELSGRELEVLQKETELLSSKEIAKELKLSVASIAKYRERIYHRLHVTSRMNAVIAAVKIGLVPSPFENKPIESSEFDKLSPAELQMLEWQISSVDQLGEKPTAKFEYAESSPNNLYASIYKKFGVGDQRSVCLFYLEARKRGLIADFPDAPY